LKDAAEPIAKLAVNVDVDISAFDRCGFELFALDAQQACPPGQLLLTLGHPIGPAKIARNGRKHILEAPRCRRPAVNIAVMQATISHGASQRLRQAAMAW
jgi:hypothetical protein